MNEIDMTEIENMTETELIIEDIKRLYASREELLGKINEQGKEIEELQVQVNLLDDSIPGLAKSIVKNKEEIEKLSERITKFHDDACHDYEDVISRVEKLENEINMLKASVGNNESYHYSVTGGEKEKE